MPTVVRTPTGRPDFYLDLPHLITLLELLPWWNVALEVCQKKKKDGIHCENKLFYFHFLVSVVASQLKAYDTANVQVVDASVIPLQVCIAAEIYILQLFLLSE